LWYNYYIKEREEKPMKITNKIPESKPARYISTCYPNEAFKFADEWYTMIQSNFDQVIDSTDEQVEKFVEGHVHRYSCHYDLLPCIELSSMVFVLLEDRLVDEWAEVEAILTPRS
jgi:hypothetical protein